MKLYLIALVDEDEDGKETLDILTSYTTRKEAVADLDEGDILLEVEVLRRFEAVSTTKMTLVEDEGGK